MGWNDDDVAAAENMTDEAGAGASLNPSIPQKERKAAPLNGGRRNFLPDVRAVPLQNPFFAKQIQRFALRSSPGPEPLHGHPPHPRMVPHVHARDRLPQPLPLLLRKQRQQRDEICLIAGPQMILRPDI